MPYLCFEVDTKCMCNMDWKRLKLLYMDVKFGKKSQFNNFDFSLNIEISYSLLGTNTCIFRYYGTKALMKRAGKSRSRGEYIEQSGSIEEYSVILNIQEAPQTTSQKKAATMDIVTATLGIHLPSQTQ